MPRRDLKNNVDVVQSLAPASRNAAANGSGVDLKGFNAAMVVFDAGAIGGTSPSFTFQVEESDDNSVFTPVADEDLQGTEPVFTAGDQIARVGYIGNKRWIRSRLDDVQGTSPTLLCSSSVVRGKPDLAPVA